MKTKSEWILEAEKSIRIAFEARTITRAPDAIDCVNEAFKRFNEDSAECPGYYEENTEFVDGLILMHLANAVVEFGRKRAEMKDEIIGPTFAQAITHFYEEIWLKNDNDTDSLILLNFAKAPEVWSLFDLCVNPRKWGDENRFIKYADFLFLVELGWKNGIAVPIKESDIVGLMKTIDKL